MYFNYKAINMRSIYYFLLPSPNTVSNIIHMQLYSCVCLFLSRGLGLYSFFFPDSSISIYVMSEAGLGKKRIYLSVFINCCRINREWFFFTTDGPVL